MADISQKMPEYTAYTLKDVVDSLGEIEKAVSDVSHKTPEYTAYTLQDVVGGLWEIEKAIRGG